MTSEPMLQLVGLSKRFVLHAQGAVESFLIDQVASVLGAAHRGPQLSRGRANPESDHADSGRHDFAGGELSELEEFTGKTIRFQAEEHYAQEQYDVVLL